LSDPESDGSIEAVADGLEWTSEDHAWRYVQAQAKSGEELVFFKSLKLARDGGLSEVNGKKNESDHLWYNSRYFSALLLLVFFGLNVFFIFQVDLHTLRQDRSNLVAGSAQAGQYLITRGILEGVNSLLQQVFGRSCSLTPTQIICGTELCLMCVLLANVMFCIAQVLFSKALDACCWCCLSQATIQRWQFKRWFAASTLFWELIPQVGIFSAMKLLFFITPQVLTLHLNTILFYDTTNNKALALLWFVISRAVAAIIGFDSFLVKYRTTSEFILAQDMSINNLLAAVVLLNQILGVVQVAWVIRDRLFRFVFGGQDGVMDPEEKVRMNTWNALVAQRIWQKYTNPFDKVALLLTFCDDDFQRMALEEDQPVGVVTGVVIEG